MAKQKKGERPEDILTKVTKKVENFLLKNLKIILISLGTAVVLAAAFFTTQYMNNRKERVAESAFSKVYLAFDRVRSDESLDEVQIQESLTKLVEDFKVVLDQYPQSAAASRSAYYIGNILYRYEKYEEALQFYKQGGQIKPKGYSALLSAQGEASCYEQLGDYEKAEERYNDIIAKYADSFLVPMVRFSLGQIYEKQDNFEMAREQYDLIVSEYSWSSWASIAEKKILLLKNS
jgi:tetratricopeptide (TPR) repeat protein